MVSIVHIDRHARLRVTSAGSRYSFALREGPRVSSRPALGSSWLEFLVEDWEHLGEGINVVVSTLSTMMCSAGSGKWISGAEAFSSISSSLKFSSALGLDFLKGGKQL